MLPRLHVWLRPTVGVLAIHALALGQVAGREGQEVRAGFLSKADQAAVIERVGEMLRDRYVFPDVANQCSEHLAALSSGGAFSQPVGPEDFVVGLTEALQEISHDKHMSVRVRRVEDHPLPDSSRHPFLERGRRLNRERGQNFGFEKVERLEGNVGYIDLRYFSIGSEAIDAAAAAMSLVANADALIFDMRRNGGGHPGMVHFLSSYLFSEPRHLNSFYFREGDRTEDYWTLPGVPGTQVPDVPVFVLTGPLTFSGAEEFSYNLKTQKRATLVGETTRGGANPGDTFQIDAQFEIFIPIGRAINPVTGTNWEGTGVKPHVSVPAPKALAKALELAVPAAEAHRHVREAPWRALEGAYLEAVRQDDAGDSKSAARTLEECLRLAHGTGLLDESEVNRLGHEFLADGRLPLSIAALSVNVESYPDSANAHDSLGEAQRAAGDRKRSMASYGRCIELAPEGPLAEAARAALAEMKALEDAEADGR